MAELRQNANWTEAEENQDESVNHHGNTRLPYGLCERYGISLPDKATPRDAWDALKGKGITPQQVYKDLQKSSNSSNEQVKDGKFASRQEALDYVEASLGMHLETSLSALPDDVLIPNIEKLTELNNLFNCIKNDEHIWFSGANTGSRFTVGSTTLGRIEAKVKGLNLCSRYYSNLQVLITSELKSRDAGYSVQFSDEYAPYATITHEYGHILLENILAQTSYTDDAKRRVEEAKKRAGWRGLTQQAYKRAVDGARKQYTREYYAEIIGLAKKISADTGLDMNLAEYQQTDYEEFFAESFLNSLGGKPNAIGKAMTEFLKRRFK